ncbi:MAG: hypothetical protein IJ864_05430 [Alphaproteobacteria bacterium]|nr:hypothetical protein [Alphaproteobacteria bacterium]
MNKIAKITNCIIISGFLFMIPAKRADAFSLIPIPPQPWSIELDIPGDVTKVFSELKALGLQTEVIASQLKATALNSIKGTVIGKSMNKLGGLVKLKDKAVKKTPGKSAVVVPSTELSIAEGDTNELNYYNAYQKLFFLYPSMDAYTDLGGDKENGIEGYQTIQSAYHNKSVEYRQDVMVDTYFAGLLTERYLLLVEKTLNRLERCQNGLEHNMSKCVFFGLQMVEIPTVENPDKELATEDSQNPGLLAQAKNAYIVSTVYDRLMRIVEELTATEAIYRAAKQIELVKPESENQSSAERYLPQKYHFAQREIRQLQHAKVILSQKNKKACLDGSQAKNCVSYNEDAAELNNMDDAKILSELQPIENALNAAMKYHNLKTQLPQYKTQYRRYLKTKEMHERAKKALTQSDSCVQEFINNHLNPDSTTPIHWGKPQDSTLHENRPLNSISRQLIMAYQQKASEVIIGDNGYCDGYYEVCPDGYQQGREHCKVLDENGEVKFEDKNLHPCMVETIEAKESSAAENISALTDANESTINETQAQTDKQIDTEDEYVAGDYTDSDYLKSGSVEDIEEQNHIQSEQAWRIGSKMMMDLANSGALKFNPWNDQQSLQEEYLRQKYLNMKKIIQSTDKAMNSYKIAANKANAYNDNSLSDELASAIQSIVACPLEGVEDKAQQECLDGEISIDRGVISCLIEEDSIDIGTQIASLANNAMCKFKRIIGNTTEGISSLSVSNLVKGYFKDILGGSAEELYSKAQQRGRLVAQDKLTSVMLVRQAEEVKLQKVIADYEAKQAQNKALSEKYKKDILKYNDSIDKATKLQNQVKLELRRSNQRVSSITSELNSNLADLIKKNQGNREYLCSLQYQKMKLEYERATIQGQKASWNCPKLCQEIDAGLTHKKLCDTTPTQYTISLKNKLVLTEDVPNKNVLISEAQTMISSQEQAIESYTQQRKILKEKVQKLEEQMRQAAENFADDYIDQAIASQTQIEKANEAYEKFLQKDERMENTQKSGKCIDHGPLGIGCLKHANATYKEDDLSTTITHILEDNGQLKPTVKRQLEQKYFADLNQLAQDLNIPSTFVVDASIGSIIGLPSGTVLTSQKLIQAVKEKILEAAAEQITNYITNADEIISQEIDSATKEIESHAQSLGLCESCSKPLSAAYKQKISSHQNYGDSGEITKAHNSLINKLRHGVNQSELAAAGIEVSDMFGIPTELEGMQEIGTVDENNNIINSQGKVIGTATGSIAYDSDQQMIGHVVISDGKKLVKQESIADTTYFVSLPARGQNYRGQLSTDTDAGRDFIAPKGPMLNLPPLREIFYYDSEDYDATPKSKKKKKDRIFQPDISYLLNKKYPTTTDADVKEWEYLPEIWRYLLARPNLRQDHLYQQTFVERSFDTGGLLKNMINNTDISGNAGNYRTIISRADIYPCKLGGKIYDIYGGKDNKKVKNNITDIRFVTRGMVTVTNSLTPVSIQQQDTETSLESVPTCQEIELYSKSPCNTYKQRKGGICHLLADHGKQKNKAKNKNDYQDSLDAKNSPLYEGYSELGQFLDGDLRYRALHQRIHQYLIDPKNSENNINRQKAETASFKRNLFGSFLNAVNSEHILQKSEDQMAQEIKTILTSMCAQIHEQGKVVSNNPQEVVKGECDKNCEARRDEVCAEYIFDHGGLAYSADKDTRYGVDGEYHDATYEGINCANKDKASYYEQYFCDLGNLKASQVAEAERLYKELKKNHSELSLTRAKERVERIEKQLAALKKDMEEVTFMTADSTKDTVNVENAKADRVAERISDDEGIRSIENQSQVVPYCPTYIKEKVK